MIDNTVIDGMIPGIAEIHFNRTRSDEATVLNVFPSPKIVVIFLFLYVTFPFLPFPSSFSPQRPAQATPNS